METEHPLNRDVGEGIQVSDGVNSNDHSNPVQFGQPYVSICPWIIELLI